MTPEDNRENKSKIEELKKSLYSRNAPDIREKRRLHFGERPTGGENAVQTDWEHPPEKPAEEVVLTTKYKPNSMSFFTKFLIGSITFFVIAMSVGAYLVFNGENIISANNIDIIINGPVTVAGGDPLSLGVQVNNKNNIKLQAVDMVVDFPAGTVDAIDRSKELKQFRETMEDISPGGLGQKNVQAVLYGEENTKKEITITVSYRVAGSNAVFKKQKTYEILISSSPLSLSVSAFKEVTSGQEVQFEVTLMSNSADVIKNLLLKATFPFGFAMTSTDIKTEGNGSTWKIGDIPSHGKKVITFKGRLEGQDNELRVFRFAAGAQSIKTAGVIGTEYIAATQDITIKKPFISASIAFDNDTDEGVYVGAFNSPIKATVSWFNNLPTSIIDGEIHLKLSGNSFDKVSVAPGEGLYVSADNEIVWNGITTPALGTIGAGESGSVTFTFTPRDFSTPLKPVTSPSLALNVNVSGKRISEANVPESVVSSAQRIVKVSSQLSLSSTITRPADATGPIPPKAERQTTYTVNWVVDNTANTATDAGVRALLPAYVKWIGKVTPGGEDVSYNSKSGEVVWRVGNVDSYTINRGHRRVVSFQIGFTPSVAQVGQAPLLVQDTTLTGQDDFTGAILTSTHPALSTNYSGDPTFKEGNERVVP